MTAEKKIITVFIYFEIRIRRVFESIYFCAELSPEGACPKAHLDQVHVRASDNDKHLYRLTIFDSKTTNRIKTEFYKVKRWHLCSIHVCIM